MPQATVKSYDSLTETGTLVADDGETLFHVDKDSLTGGMFRFLRPGQRVTFDVHEGSDKVTNVRIGIS